MEVVAVLGVATRNTLVFIVVIATYAPLTLLRSEHGWMSPLITAVLLAVAAGATSVESSSVGGRTPVQLRDTSTRPNYIDILKDRKIYEEVQRSRTNEVNSEWSTTFLAFFGLEMFLLCAFVLFGVTMFIALQFRPRQQDKFIALTV